jgi:GT2 family glycosyltransferase
MSNRRTIGVVTPWYAKGFGNALRTYALNTCLIQQGFQPILFHKPLDLGEGSAQTIDESSAGRFIRAHCELLPALDSSDAYTAAVARCGTFVTGMGDIWDYEQVGESGHYFFLDFVPVKKPKIAFAVDCHTGGAVPYDYAKVAEGHLNSFSAISVAGREDQWIIQENYGVTSDIVADPLLLLSSEECEHLARHSELTHERFVYVDLQAFDERAENISKAIAESVNGSLVTDEAKSPEDWVWLIKNSEFVVTDSQDTMLLAILLNRPFAGFASLYDRRDSSLVNLLETVGLSGRLFDVENLPEHYEQVFMKPVYYNSVNAFIKTAAERSSKWLLTSLREASFEETTTPLSSVILNPDAHVEKKPVLTSIDYKIQNLIFPSHTWEKEHFWLFNRGERLEHVSSSATTGTWELDAGGSIECSTYFNALSVKKWARYTSAKKFYLHLFVQGKFRVRMFGIWIEPGIGGAVGKAKRKSLESEFQTIRGLDVDPAIKRELVQSAINDGKVMTEELGEYRFDCSNPPVDDSFVEVILPVHYDRATLTSFELFAESPCTIFKGYYSACSFEELFNPVDISLCMTTFKKEEFVVANIELFKSEILGSSDRMGMEELAEHLFVNVIDNGRTLLPALYETPSVRIHQNPNAGGAGGFARGMLETIYEREQEEFNATHVLLMDDDVKFLPETLKRTYALLRLLKEEHKERFVSGAMFYLEEMHHFHEDVGMLRKSASEFGAQKPSYLMHAQDNILKCEEYDPDDFDPSCSYAAWWYCVVPIKFIAKDNLPVPLFFRGDDVEFSLRNKARFITMNSICVWHLGFMNKFSAALEYYLVHRNGLFISAVSGILEDASPLVRIKQLFKQEICRFHYAAAEQLLDSVEDFLAGPEYFATVDGEQVMKEHTAKNEKMIPLPAFDYPVNLDTVYEWKGLNEGERLLYEKTDNGHLLPESYLIDDEYLPAIPHDWFDNPGKQFLRRRLVAANIHAKTVVLRTMDRERYEQLIERYEKLMKRFENEQEAIVANYRNYAKTFYSEAFWRDYLRLG